MKLVPTKALKFLSDTQYDAEKAKDFWYYEVASYCTPNNIQIWNVSTVAQIFPNVQDISILTESSGDNQAYTAYDSDNELIVLAVRGSANIENWFENLDAFKTTYENCDGCEVHEGFYNAYLDLKDQILPSILNLQSKHSNAKIAVIGHSLGAAIATFAFVDLQQQINSVDYFYTYGSPRIGNTNFVNFLNSNFPNVFKARLTHYKDPVPHLPLDSMGFLHIDREVYYVEDSSSYNVCLANEEDPNCANQFDIIDPEISDHLNYMAFSQTDYKANCQ